MLLHNYGKILYPKSVRPGSFYRPLRFPMVMPSAAVALGVISLVNAHAQLRWERTVHTFEASRSQEVVVATFPFLNSGTTPISIRSIKTTCGCTTGELSREIYQPGEKDELIASFLLRGRRGSQEKKISVRTSDPASDVDLILKGNIQELATVKPIFLMWRAGAPADWKSSIVRVADKEPMQIEGISCNSGAFETKLDVLDPGREYAVRVRPTSGTDVPQTALVEIRTTAAGSPQSLYVHARIK